MRNPRRTASTAAALMIGLALVSFVSIFAASIKASTTKTLEDTVSADYILMNDNFQPFSPEAAQRLAEQPRAGGGGRGAHRPLEAQRGQQEPSRPSTRPPTSRSSAPRSPPATSATWPRAAWP